SYGLTKTKGGWRTFFIQTYLGTSWDPYHHTTNLRLLKARRQIEMISSSLNNVWGNAQSATEIVGIGTWNYRVQMVSAGSISVGISKRNFIESRHQHMNQATFQRLGFKAKAETYQIGYRGSWGYNSHGFLVSSLPSGEMNKAPITGDAMLKKGDVLTMTVI